MEPQEIPEALERLRKMNIQRRNLFNSITEMNAQLRTLDEERGRLKREIERSVEEQMNRGHE